MTQEQYLTARRARLGDLLTERSAAQTALVSLRERAETGDTEVTREAVAAAIATRDAADATVDAARDELEALEAEVARDAELLRLAEMAAAAPAQPARQVTTASVRVGAEPRTYGRDHDPRHRGKDFLTDVLAEFRGNSSARDRLERHMSEERVERGERLFRATGTANFTGWVIPQYLVDMNAPAAVAGRQFADLCTKHDLPETGMTAYLSKITTGSSVDDQSSSGADVSETDMDDTQVSIAVRTAAGSQSISRQAIERGLGVDEVTIADLLKRYAKNLDGKLLNASTSGLTNVATTVAYTDASPTAAELYPKLQAAASGAEGIFLGTVTDLVAVMHPRRWRWLAAAMTSTWPFVSGGAGGFVPPQAGAAHVPGALSESAPIRGYLPDGTPVVTDANVATGLGTGTNEDEIYIVAPEECHLWEDPNAPMFIRAESTPKKLLIDLVVYGYYAFYLDRYTGGHQKIAGTGLVTPSF